MSVEIGIIGLTKSGRTTVFNALTSGKADTGSYTHGGSTHNIGVAKVPDHRLKALTDMLQPKKVVPTEVTYVDMGVSVADLVKEKTLTGQLLNQIRNVDAIINVVRAFSDDTIPHTEGSLDVERDITAMNLELTFSDLALIDRRLERIDISLKGAKPPERPPLLREQELLVNLKTDLEKEVPVRELDLTDEQNKLIANYQMMTAKPLLIAVNIGEDQLAEAKSLEIELRTRHARPKCRLMALCGKLEMELAQLDIAAAEELRQEFESGVSGSDRVIQLSYELLGLVSFFTIASGEVKAWPVRKDTEASKAAGKIHTDMEKGFIRAEVIHHNDLVACGSLSQARQKGLIRLEGKSYKVQDGDVITFLFNV